jgi:hypothetical protein
MPSITDWNIHNLWKFINPNFQEGVLKEEVVGFTYKE